MEEAEAMKARAEYRLSDSILDEKELHLSLDCSRELLNALRDNLILQRAQTMRAIDRMVVISPLGGKARPLVDDGQYTKVGTKLFEVT